VGTFSNGIKLEIIIDKLGTNSETVLNEFTGVSRSTIRRCKTLLWYPTKYRDILMEKGGKISTDFFIELYPIVHRLSYESEYKYPDGISIFIDSCIDKFKEQKHFSDVKEFREVRKSLGFYEKSNDFPEFMRKVDEFTNNDIGLDIFISENFEEEINKKNILKNISFLNTNLEGLNANLISDLFFEEQLKQLQQKLNQIIESID